MTHCQPDARDRVRSAARQLADRQCVVTVDVLAPADSPVDGWTVAAMLSRPDVPTTVARVLVDHDLAHRTEPPRERYTTVLATHGD